MNRTSEPDAAGVKAFARRMKKQNAGQHALDEIIGKYFQLDNPISTARGKGSEKVPDTRFRSGIGGMLIEEDASLLVDLPALTFIAPTDDPKDKEHADGLLEPWTYGIWEQSQEAGDVWADMPFDLRGFGRAWDSILPHPYLWATDEYQALVDALNDENDHAERVKIEKDMAAFKRDTCPIRWKSVDFRNCWTTFTSPYWLPEVVEILKAPKIEIIEEFGAESIPDEFDKAKDETSLEYYVWANHEWACAVVPGKESPGTMVMKFNHKMHMNPYGLMEAQTFRRNSKGLRWKSAIFYARDMIDTLDQLLSELRQNHDENTRTPRYFKVDRESYPDDQLVDGRPAPMAIEDGVTLYNDEDIGLIPVPEINQQSIALLSFTYNLVKESQIRPASRGQVMSGTSEVMQKTSAQLAEREFTPATNAQSRHAKSVVKRFFATVDSLGEAIPILAGRKGAGALSVGPDDIKGWKNALSVNISRAIPIDRGLQYANAKSAIDSGLSLEFAYEVELDIMHPEQEIRNKRRYQSEQAVYDQVVQPLTVQRAEAIAAKLTPQQETQFNDLFASAPSDLQDYLQKNGIGPSATNPTLAPPNPANAPAPGIAPTPDPSQSIPGANGQSQANVGRTGVPEQPQQPQGVPVGQQ